MRLGCTIFLIYLLSNVLTGQSLPNTNFNRFDTIICPFDNTTEIIWPTSWEVYQTKSGTWDGEIDSSRCLTVEPFAFGFNLHLEQLDLDLPFFIRCNVETDGPILLSPNNLYRSQLIFSHNRFIDMDLSGICGNGLCTGLISGIRIPDENGNCCNIRYHFSNAVEESGFVTMSTCVPTERFNDHFLNDFVAKFTFDPTANLDGEIIKFWGASFHLVYYQGSISSISFPNEGPGTLYNFGLRHFSDPEYAENMLVLYPGFGYPSLQNPGYVEPVMVPNSSQQETINLYVDVHEFLAFQPYTFIRGALVEGSDTIRHEVNLINDGGDICLELVEIVLDGPTHFLYRDGKLHLNGPTACMQFSNGSKLIVDEGATLIYGQNGNGILALRTGSSIKIKNGGTLVINSKLSLSESKGEILPGQVYMDLNEGSKLIFGPTASITNENSLDGSMKLNVYMKGGQLDDHLLPAKQRLLINRIYPSQESVISKLEIFPNPANSDFYIRFNGDKTDVVSFKLYNMHGNLIAENSLSIQDGNNKFNININYLPSGIYFLKINDNADLVKRIIKGF